MNHRWKYIALIVSVVLGVTFSGFIALRPARAAAAGENAAVSVDVPLQSRAFTPQLAPSQVLTATKTDVYSGSAAEPGETITYTVVVTNDTPGDALGLTISDVIDLHTAYISDSLRVTPLAITDTYNAIGNTHITITATNGLLANDVDPDDPTPNPAFNDGLFVTDFDATSANGGDVSVNADGSFTYDPPAGYTGTDTFTYTVSDGHGLTDTGVVTVTISDMVWYIDNAAPAGGDGRSESPFASIAAFNSGASDSAGDVIFLYEGSGHYDGGFTLLDTQQLIGQGVDLAATTGLTPPLGTALPAVAANPILDNTGGDAVTLNLDNAIHGLTIGITGGYAFARTGDIGTAVINTVSITGTGGLLYVDSSDSGILSATFDTLTTEGYSGDVLRLISVNGSVTATAGSITHAAAGDTIAILSGGVDVTFPGLITKSGGGALLTVAGGHSGDLAFNGDVSASAGNGVQANNADGTYTFNGDFDISGGTAGINLENGTDGSFAFLNSDASITGVSGVSFRVNSGLASVDYDGSITHTSPTNRGVEIVQGTGAISFDGVLQIGTSVTPMSGADAVFLSDTGSVNPVTFSTLHIATGVAGGASGRAFVSETSGRIVVGGGSINCDGDLGVDAYCFDVSDTSSDGVTFDSLRADHGSSGENGGGIRLVANAGSFTFATVSRIIGANARGVYASNGGALTLGSTAPGPVSIAYRAAVDVTNTTLNATVTGMSAIASPDHGINLDGIDGSFSATGNVTVFMAAGSNEAVNVVNMAAGSTVSIGDNRLTINDRRATGVFVDNAQGTIGFGPTNIPNPQGVSAPGIRVQNSGANVIFAEANVSDVVRTTQETVDNNTPLQLPTSDGDGNSIFLSNNSGTFTLNGGTISNSGDDALDMRNVGDVTLDGVIIDGTGDYGVQGVGVANLTVRNSTIQNFGDDAGNPNAAVPTTDSGMWFRGLTGAVAISNSTFGPDANFILDPFPPPVENDGIEVWNRDAADLTMTVTGSTFTQISNDGIDLRGERSTVALDVDGSSTTNNFSQINGRAISLADNADDVNNETLTLDVNDNAFSTLGIAARMSVSGGSSGVMRVLDNTMSNISNDAVRVLGNPANLGFTTNLDARITGNDFGTGDAFLVARRQADVRLLFDNNTNVGQDNGTASIISEASRGGDLDLTLTNNTVVIDESVCVFCFAATYFQVANPSGAPAADMCLDARNNTVTVQNAGTTVFAEAMIFDRSHTSDINLAGWDGSGGEAGAAAFLSGNNTLSGTSTPSVGYFGTSPNVSAGPPTCDQPVAAAFSDAVVMSAPPFSVDAVRAQLTSLATAFRFDVSGPAPVTSATAPERQSFLVADRIQSDAVGVALSSASPAARWPGEETAVKLGAYRSKPMLAPAALPAFATPGDTVSLLDDPFTLPPGMTFTVTFAVSVTTPLPGGVDSVQNQAIISGDNFADVLSVDPEPHPAFPTANGETITPLSVPVDLEIIKDDGQTTAVPGTATTYTIVAANNGPNGVSGATVSDSFPAALTGVTWTCVADPGASCTASGSGDVSDAVDLAVGSSVTYTVHAPIDSAATGTLANTASVSGNSYNTDPAPGNNSATDSNILTPEVDVMLAKSESVDPVVAGSGAGNLTYVITATNNGPSDASNVTISETLTLPAGVTVNSITPGAGSFISPTWTLPDLDAGQSETLTVMLTVDVVAAAGSDVISDTATVTGADQTLINTLDDSVSEATSIVREADLAVTMTESADPVTAGSGVGNLTYVVTVENLGPSNASGVALTDTLTLPAGVTLDSVAPGGGTSWDGIDTWTVGDLPAGDSETLTLVVTVGPSATTGVDVIANEAAVIAANEADGDTVNNSAAEATSVTTAADLVVDKVDRPDPAVAGETLTYTITITNNGPSDAQNVVATDVLTDALTLQSTGGCAEDPGGAPTCSLGTIAAGSTAHYTITALVDSATLSSTITNTVTVASTTPEAAPGDESVTVATNVNVVADLELRKVDNPDPVLAGEVLTYTLTLTNHGPSQAWGVYVGDWLPLAYNHTGNDCGVFYSRPDPFEWVINDMPAGTVLTCVITGTVDAGVSGTITNTAFASTISFVTDPDPGNDSLDEPTTVYDTLFEIGDVTQTEGDAGVTAFTFTITRTSATTASSVDYATADDTAVAGQDYTATSGTVNFAAGGSLTQSVTISVTGDTVDENDETFFVNLSNPGSGGIGDGQGVGTILDDDAPPQLSVDDASAPESDGVLTFTISLDNASSFDVTVAYSTTAATAAEGSDYTGVSGVITIPAGTTTGVVSVPLLDDALHETDETFTLTLSSPTNATVADGSGVGAILDDDPAVVDFNAATYALGEGGGTATISVTLSTPAAFTVTADYASGDGTATGGSDYTPISGTVHFAPGETNQTISLPVLDDTLDEIDETVLLTLTNAVSATLGTANNPATLAILDDDGEPTLNFSTFTYSAAEAGGNATITVTLSNPSGLTVTVDYASSDGTATAGDDYGATSGTLTIPAGQTAATFTLPLLDDALHEADETVTLTLSSPTNATIGAVEPATLTIVDDDPPPGVSFTAAAYTTDEEAGSRTITVTLDAVSALDATVNVVSSDGTATAGDDYLSISDTLTIPAGERTASLTVPILSDDLDERDETLQLTVNDPANALLTSPMTATLTIVDDDATIVFLPLAFQNVSFLPDLVVETLQVDEEGVTIIIANRGDRTVATPFWVDVYLDPDPAPTSVNQTWPQVSEEGMAWGVTTSLAPGEALTLTVGGPYYRPDASNFSGVIPAGTLVYAQVDSANAGVSYGAVLESHEQQGESYNNILGPIAAPNALRMEIPRFGSRPEEVLPPRR